MDNIIKVSIIGTGQIGYDLLYKLLKLDFIEFVVFVGRRASDKVLPENIIYSDKSIDYFILNPNCCDIVFDCTDSNSSIINSKVFIKQNIKIINLTPSTIGEMYIPNITPINNNNLNMITCGGQATIPLLYFLYNNSIEPIYAEIITQISSESAGLATRINIDKYIETTEIAIYNIIGIKKCKVILNINPCLTTTMRSTIYLKTTNCDYSNIRLFIKTIQEYVINYEITEPIWLSKNILMIHINIIGSGDYISKYHGNLDIINCVAINALKQINNQ
jgi:acetaldehyde dehydrogenase